MRTLVTLMLLTTCSLLIAAEEEPSSQKGAVQLPELTTIDGKKLDDEALADKVVVIEFWATWCGTCVGEVPHLKELYKQYHDKGVVFIGLAEETDKDVVAQYVKRHEIPWHVALDDENALAKQFKVKALPRAVILSRDHAIVWQGEPHDIDKALREAAKQKD